MFSHSYKQEKQPEQIRSKQCKSRQAKSRNQDKQNLINFAKTPRGTCQNLYTDARPISLVP